MVIIIYLANKFWIKCIWFPFAQVQHEKEFMPAAQTVSTKTLASLVSSEDSNNSSSPKQERPSSVPPVKPPPPGATTCM